MTIGELVRLLIYKGNLTQNDIATLLGCTQATVSRLKNNKQNPTLKMLKKLANMAKEYEIPVNLNEVIINKD